MTTISESPHKQLNMEAGLNPLQQTAVYILWGHALLWLFLLFRWLTFGSFEWKPGPVELALAQWGSGPAYLIYGALIVIDVLLGIGLLRDMPIAKKVGIGRSVLLLLLSILYFVGVRDFYGASLILALSGFLLILLLRHTAWALAFPAAFWLGVFFVAPMLIVLIVSFGERTRLGTVAYPEFSFSNLGAYFDDYLRFFRPIGGEYIYLRIFWRSVGIALFNTVFCLLLAYPFAYWIARQREKYRNTLVFLVMIPFWTNFLVRTYAWMLILRDSGLINNFWTITLHEQAVMLAENSQFFTWLAEITARKLPLLFNQPAVMMGLLYGYFPFMVLPLYSNLEKLDWSLLEAAADLGANAWRSTLRVLIPLSMPGIVSGSIIVFIPSLGAYVTPDLLGGAKVALLGNLLQQQFMTVRDWPFGSAIGFLMMAIMLAATLLYFRTSVQGRSQNDNGRYHPQSRSQTKTRRRTRHELRAAFNQRILTWLSIGIFLFLYIPILILIIYSFNANKVVGVWTGFSTDWYRILFQDQAFINAFRVSMWVAFWSTIISTILGTLGAIVLERYRFRGKLTFDAVMYLPIIIPDIVMALSTLLFFVIFTIPLSRYTILIAHVAFNIAFVALVVRARLADMDDRLEEAASDLGANEWVTFRRVTLPLLMPGVVSGALLAFTLSLDDFVITFFVAGPGSTTLPVQVYSMIKFGVTPEVNAISTLMFVGSTILVVISLALQRK